MSKIRRGGVHEGEAYLVKKGFLHFADMPWWSWWGPYLAKGYFQPPRWGLKEICTAVAFDLGLSTNRVRYIMKSRFCCKSHALYDRRIVELWESLRGARVR
jgi:hypothetical protein